MQFDSIQMISEQRITRKRVSSILFDTHTQNHFDPMFDFLLPRERIRWRKTEKNEGRKKYNRFHFFFITHSLFLLCTAFCALITKLTASTVCEAFLSLFFLLSLFGHFVIVWFALFGLKINHFRYSIWSTNRIDLGSLRILTFYEVTQFS